MAVSTKSAVTIDEQFNLHGKEVLLEEAEALKLRGMSLLDSADAQQPLSADFKGLSDANSVTVALMMAWHRHAAKQQKTVVFTNLSAELRDIIEFSGLSTVLNVPT